jgi:hypothetical protein
MGCVFGWRKKHFTLAQSAAFALPQTGTPGHGNGRVAKLNKTRSLA